jgi:hypothetical protein
MDCNYPQATRKLSLELLSWILDPLMVDTHSSWVEVVALLPPTFALPQPRMRVRLKLSLFTFTNLCLLMMASRLRGERTIKLTE